MIEIKRRTDVVGVFPNPALDVLEPDPAVQRASFPKLFGPDG